MEFEPEVPFQLDEKLFGKNLRSSKRGAAGGPSGMTSDHLRPLLSDLRDMKLLFQLGERTSPEHVPFNGCGYGQSRENDGASKARRRSARRRGRRCGQEIGCKDRVSTVGTSNHGGHRASSICIVHTCRLRMRRTYVARCDRAVPWSDSDLHQWRACVRHDFTKSHDGRVAAS